MRIISSLHKFTRTAFYGYFTVAATFLLMLLTFGTIYSYGVFLKPMLDDLGWTVAMTSGAYSLSIFIRGLLSFVNGRLTDRFGPRLVMTVCGLFLGAGYLLMSLVQTSWQLYLFYGIIIAVGQSNFVPAVSTAARWFVKRRGLMTGIVVAGSGVGTALIAPVARWMIATYDWRTSFALIGAVTAVLITIIAQFLKRDPAKMGLQPYGANEPSPDSSQALPLPASSFTYREALRTGQLWIVCLAFFTMMFIVQTMLVHIVNHAISLGISATNAANIVATIAAAAVFGKITIGIISDRIGVRKAMVLGLGLLGLGSLLVIPSRELWMLFLTAVLVGLGWGTGSLMAPVSAELFGELSLGAIMGIADFATSIGGTAGPVLAGRVFDVAGNYQPAFIICALVAMGSIIAVLLLKPPRKPGIAAKSLGKSSKI